MPREITLETAVETAALTLLEFLQNSLNDSIPFLSEGIINNDDDICNFRERQKLLLEEIKLTNTKLENQDHYEYIALSFSKLPKYLSKLQSIRKTMITISSSTKILKHRANQLKLIKQYQLNQFAKIHERERNFDQTVLAAKYR
ncbi:8431_t:CDS:2 [Entrophospora sp. SA101]|nr:10346_t:CDS:2 [Entrophospora sp. SA101]CAJ0828666.1 8431_t:CDS:2 [Entrophospora sp. SA101]CAJ0902341.1 10376_t:CDS:2 [Entrophospora sp. SA101]